MKRSRKKTSKKKAVNKKAKRTTKKKPVIKRPDVRLRRAAYSGVVALILSLMIAYMGFITIDSKSQLINYMGIMAFAAFFSILYLFGFARLGKRAKNSTLWNAAYMLIALTVVDIGYLLIITSLNRPEHPYASAVFLFFYGAIAIMFGKGVYDLKAKLGRLAKATGIMNMIAGVLTLTIVLAGFGILIALFAEFLNIAVLFRSSEAYA
ncbi:hypothetical protein ACFL96_17755 [Thermoproteota archaeon]